MQIVGGGFLHFIFLLLLMGISTALNVSDCTASLFSPSSFDTSSHCCALSHRQLVKLFSEL